MQEGLLVSSIKYGLKDNIIVSRELKKYSEKDLEICIKKFEIYKKDGVIENENFNDNHWRLLSDDGSILRRNVKIDFENNLLYSNILKSYLINLLENSLGINSVADRVLSNRDMLYETNFFNADNYENYEEFILNKSDNEIIRFRDANKEFIGYLNHSISEEYTDFLDSINIKIPKNTREIPDYRSVLYFDYGVNMFVNGEKDNNYQKFMPILLWWKISSKIPIRPIEFMKLEKYCFFKEDDKCYIKIKRRKPNNFVQRALKLTKEQVFRVNEELYDFATEYVNNSHHTSEFFICINHYNTYNRVRAFKKTNHKRIQNYILSNLLEEFYCEVISKQWYINIRDKKKYKQHHEEDDLKDSIIRMTLGDSRHLAIINLILQGTNHYLVKEMAGHRDINSHLHYTRHAKEYVSSKVLVLTDILRFEIKSIEQNKKVQFSVGNKRYEKLQRSNSSQFMKVGNYYCKRYVDKEVLFPYLCISSCKECNDGILDVDNINIDEINKEIIYSKTQMEKYLDVIKSYIDEVEIKTILDNRREKYLFSAQQHVEEAGNRIEYLAYREAELEAYKFQKQLIEVEGEQNE